MPQHQHVSALQDFMDSTVNNASPQDSGIPNKMLVFAQHPEQFGIQLTRHAIALQDYSANNV
jgi:hypothetical protein